jgi:hypothetical protein
MKEGVKHRSRGQMDSFDCDGWMHITVFKGSNEVFVKLKHKDCHVPYWRTDVPKHIQEYVKENPKLKTPQVGRLSYHVKNNELI